MEMPIEMDQSFSDAELESYFVNDLSISYKLQIVISFILM